ncbi:hypothetical protein OR1_02817 [Geobacter sp. OR-1]|nr:hypothetical protein OR1_02817 [Geobacter sp. OR-1]
MILFSASGYCLALRYVLPIYPFIFVMVGFLGTYLLQYRYLASMFIIWYLASAWYIAPHYLAYFNEIAGGPGNGYKYLVDGNLDWGQDLPGLKKFMDENGIKRISLSYFGADSPERYGIKYDWLPSHYLFNPEPDKEVRVTPDQLVAISATNLQGVYFDDKNQYKWLLDYKPVAKIGYSIFVYDLSGKRKFKL